MESKGFLSLLLFITFFTAYSIKLIILYRKNSIKANVLAKGGKDKAIFSAELFVKLTTLTWGASWLLLSLFEREASVYLPQLITSSILEYSGFLLISLGLAIFITAMVSMKSSWRVGIDKETDTSLITAGIYRYSRNPAFVGFFLMFSGVLAVFPSILTLIITVLNFIAIHRLVLQEEKHLTSAFGDEYIKYSKKTRRYL